jgi:hypothetical protein
VTKSSNHTLCLHRLTSNSSSTTNFLWLSPTDNLTQFSFSFSLLYSAVCHCIPILLTLYPSNWLPYIVAAWTTQHRKHMSCVRMRVYWHAAQHWAWHEPHRKHLFCCALQPLGLDHSRKHSLSIVWCHCVRENVFSMHCIATAHAQTTENTTTVLLATYVA